MRFKLFLTRLFLTLTLLGIMPNAKAEDALTHITLHFYDNEPIKYALAEKPSLSFTNSELVIQTMSVIVTHTLNKIQQITYENGGLSNIVDIQPNNPLVEITEEYISFPYLDKNTHIAIYNIQGSNILNTYIQNPGEYAFPISILDCGIYIVKLNNRSFKITIK